MFDASYIKGFWTMLGVFGAAIFAVGFILGAVIF